MTVVRPFRPLADDLLALAHATQPTSFALIPVLVTGIQSIRVCAAERLLQPKDLGWLDLCDKHREEA